MTATTVGVDVDNCLAAFVTHLRRGVRAERGVHVREAEVTDYTHLPDRAGLSMAEAVERTHADEWPDRVGSFPADVPVVEGAREALDDLTARYRVVTVTARPERFERGTRAWLDDNGFAPDDHVHADRKAELDDLDCLVDDSGANVRAFAATGRPAVLFGRPWNDGTRLPPNAVRVDGPSDRERWERAVDAVDGLLDGGRDGATVEARTGDG